MELDLIKSFIALLVLVNPIGAIPMFISLTQNQGPAEQLKTIKTASISVFTVIVVTGLIGQHILKLFGISIASFQIAGGVLIMSSAISMMNAQSQQSKQTTEEAEEAGHRAHIAVVPLAIPLLSGPGAISTVIIYTEQATSWHQYGFLVVEALGIGCLVYAALKAAAPIRDLIGRTGINIATRIMGLLLASIAVEFMADGLTKLIPAFSRGIGI